MVAQTRNMDSISSTVGNPATGTTPAVSNLLTATDNFVIPAGGST